MIKITFEVSEDFIRENATVDTTISKLETTNGINSVRVLFDTIAYKQLEEQIDNGKTEFVVSQDKLDKKSKVLYDMEISSVCMLAAFSETDIKEDSSDKN